MKKIISLVLALSMILSCGVVLSGMSFAEEETEKLLKVDYDGTGAAHLSYVRLGWLTPEIQEGDYLEYDVWLTDDVSGVGGLDFSGEGSRYCRDWDEFKDTNGIKGHPSADLSDYAYGKWYSRKVKLAAVVNGTSDNFIIVAFEGFTGKTTAYFDNIRITRNDEILEYAFKDGGSEYRYIGSHYAGDEDKITISAVDKSSAGLPDISHPDEIEVAKNLIASIPDANSVNDGNFELLNRAVKAYDNLVAGDKAQVDGSSLKGAAELYARYKNAKLGDVDGDGEITVTDALLTLQGSVGKITLSPEAQGRADVDGDGKITVTDSLLILQRAVVKIDKFPVEK